MRDVRVSDIVRSADRAGARVRVSLVPRRLDEAVWSVTARVYCRCGDAYQTTSSWEGARQKIEVFWGEHHGDGHGPTTPEEARRRRRARQRGMAKA